MSGFSHHHADEALDAYRALPARQKLEWLDAARAMTADFLPPAKLRAWQKLRGDTAYSIPRERMLALWPGFQAGLDDGEEGLASWAAGARKAGLTGSQLRDVVEDFGEWIKVRPGWTPRDQGLRAALLAQLTDR